MIFKDKVCRTVQMHGYINNVLKFILTSYPIDSVLFMVRQYAPEFPFHNHWIRKLSSTGIFSTDLYLFILLNYWQLYTWYCFFSGGNKSKMTIKDQTGRLHVFKFKDEAEKSQWMTVVQPLCQSIKPKEPLCQSTKPKEKAW